MPTVDAMRVTFTRTDAERYVVAADREVSPALEPRVGPAHLTVDTSGSRQGRRRRTVG